jgi:hypothetical protein
VVPVDSQTRRVRAHDRHLAALELRKAGATYQMIAEQLGYASARGAHKAVASALKATLKEPADEVRELELARLDAMLITLWRRVTQGDERAILTALKIGERRSKLLGLEAPRRTELSGIIDILGARELSLKALSAEELAALERIVEKLDVPHP